MAPVVTKVAQSKGIRLGKIDIDREQELASRYEVTALPTFILVKDGRVKDRRIGAMSEADLSAWL
jgi:thioredoxin 1